MFKGNHREPICNSILNSGLSSAIVEKRDIKAISVGNGHLNDFEGDLYGIKLVYERMSGGGSTTYKGIKLGARVFNLNCEGGLQSHIKEHDGTVVVHEKPIKTCGLQ